MSTSNSDRSELRDRLSELRTTLDRLDGILSNGKRLPVFVLSRAAVDLDKMTSKLARHVEALGKPSSPA
jgi:hypothetical protein